MVRGLLENSLVMTWVLLDSAVTMLDTDASCVMK